MIVIGPLTIWYSIPFFIGVLLMIIGYWLMTIWVRDCCVTWCRWETEFFVWGSAVLGAILGYGVIYFYSIIHKPICVFLFIKIGSFDLYFWYLIGLVMIVLLGILMANCNNLGHDAIVDPP